MNISRESNAYMAIKLVIRLKLYCKANDQHSLSYQQFGTEEMR